MPSANWWNNLTVRRQGSFCYSTYDLDHITVAARLPILEPLISSLQEKPCTFYPNLYCEHRILIDDIWSYLLYISIVYILLLIALYIHHKKFKTIGTISPGWQILVIRHFKVCDTFVFTTFNCIQSFKLYYPIIHSLQLMVSINALVDISPFCSPFFMWILIMYIHVVLKFTN